MSSDDEEEQVTWKFSPIRLPITSRAPDARPPQASTSTPPVSFPDSRSPVRIPNPDRAPDARPPQAWTWTTPPRSPFRLPNPEDDAKETEALLKEIEDALGGRQISEYIGDTSVKPNESSTAAAPQAWTWTTPPRSSVRLPNSKDNAEENVEIEDALGGWQDSEFVVSKEAGDPSVKPNGSSTAAAPRTRNLLQQVFQAGIIETNPTIAFLEEFSRILVNENCGVHERNDMIRTLGQHIPIMLKWITLYKDTPDSLKPVVDFDSHNDLERPTKRAFVSTAARSLASSSSSTSRHPIP